MQAAEGLVLLINGPGLAIEFDFDHVLGVGAIVAFILHHAGACDLDRERNFEEKASLPRTFLRARLHMVDKGLCREENVAKLALH